MPAKLFASIGMNQKSAYRTHMFMYGTPLLTFLQMEQISIFKKIYTNPILFLECRVFNDYDFLFGLLFLVFLDSLAGGLSAFWTIERDPAGNVIYNERGRKKRKFSSETFYKKMSKKLFGIMIAVVSIGVLKNTVIDGQQNFMSKIIDAGFYSIMLGFEGASVLKNAYKIYPWEPIKLLLKRLEVFYDKKSGKVKDE